jgi:hypothetical protein
VAKRILCLILLALLASACDMQKLMKDMTAPQDLALADQCFELLRLHDVAAVEDKFDPQARGVVLEMQLQSLTAEIPDEAPKSSSITSVNSNTTNGHRKVSVTKIYQFSKDWVAFNIETAGDSADAMQIERLDLHRVAPPPTPPTSAWWITPLALLGLGLWLLLMFVIYRRYAKKTG